MEKNNDNKVKLIEEEEKNKIKETIKKDESNNIDENNDSSKYPVPSFFKLQYFNPDPLNKINPYWILILASFTSAFSGVFLPAFSFLFGQTLNKLRHDKTVDFMTVIIDLCYKYLILGGILFVTSFAMTFLWNMIGKNLSTAIKSMYFKTILKQEQEYFDSVNTHEYCTKIQNQIKIIETGLGQKVGQSIMSVVMCFSSIIIGFVISWKLALVLISTLPFIAGASAWLTRKMQQMDQRRREKYEKAGGIAEEVLYNIKTVASFCNFRYERNRFDECLEESRNAGYSDGNNTAVAMFIIFFFIYGTYSLATWFGTILISNKDINQITGEPFSAGDVITVILCIVFGAFSIGQATPNIKAIGAACEASRDFFFLLDRVPKKIETNKENKEYPKKESINGKIEFKNVCFAYNSKGVSKEIFKNLNFSINAGERVAFVGESGSGKSTLVNLIEKLYEINSGEILVDNVNITKFDADAWRSMIGYVSQEPTLFNTSIKENVIFGRTCNEDITTNVKKALTESYAMNFIENYEENIEYRVGIKGSRLSGGQKQRVAIARAIFGDPKLLIFDEATSALDNKSEKIVQLALNNLSKNVTTIIIAHRLSTVVNCDKIFVLDKGEIVEVGNHNELLEKQGYYFTLVKSQLKSGNEETHEKNRKQSVHSNNSKKIEIKNDEEIIIEKSENEEDEVNKIEEEKKEELFSKSRSELIKILMNYKGYVLMAFISAMFCGAIMPIHGYLLSEATNHLGIPDMDEMKKQSYKTSVQYAIFAFFAGLFQFFLFLAFNRIGEYLTYTLRSRVFSHYLVMHLGFFDYPDNSPGSLLTKLSSDTTMINGIAFSMIGSIIQSISTLLVGVIFAFYYCPILALVCIGVVPFIGISSFIQIKVQYMNNKQDEKSDIEAGSIVSECVNNTKTIFTYNFQSKAVKLYDEFLETQRQSVLKKHFLSGLTFGFSQFIIYAAFSLVYYVGARLLVDNKVDYDSMNKAIFSVIFGAFGLGNAQIYVGDYAKAKEALINIFKVLFTETEIHPYENRLSDNNAILVKTKVGEINSGVDDEIINTKINHGKIEFKNVCFNYPTRQDFPVLKNLSFVIENNQKVAFVGPSGSGKSSIIQLIERFYDVTSGEILIDGKNIKDWDLIDVRRQIGLVMQEPVLFKTSIPENIKYGKLNSSDNEIVEAANKAYISKFFNDSDINNKQGNAAYDNSMISGGEKQRVAIARTILKIPKIMLLDEATSALDKNSEEIVQKALDEQMNDRTCVVVAHRLSTIINSDIIFVLQNGEIHEFGNHKELIEKKGVYFALYNSGLK